MPYIKKERRRVLDAKVGGSKEAGELNYQFTTLIKEYIDINGESYQSMNDIIGALEGAKLELYRRVISDYEDNKIQENGDVY